MNTALQVVGFTWFAGAAWIGSGLGDVWTFWHVMAIFHMGLGGGIALTGMVRS